MLALWPGLAGGAPVTNRLEVPGSSDAFAFTVRDGRQLWNFDSLTSRPELLWTLDGPAGRVVANRSFTSSDGESIGGNPLLFLDPGDYTLAVRANNSFAGDYAFDLRPLSEGALLTPGVAVAATLNPANQTRWYQFPATAGDVVQVRLQPTNSPSLLYRLYGPHGDLLESGYGTGGAVPLRAGGSHFLTVEGRVERTSPGSFGLAVTVLSNVPPVAPGPELVFNQDYPVVATTAFTNRYRFTLDQPRWLNFEARSGEGAAYWMLRGPRGVSGNRPFSSDQWDHFARQPAGDYEFYVWSPGNAALNTAWVLYDHTEAPTLTLGLTNRITNTPANATAARRLQLTAGQAVYFRALGRSGYPTWGPAWKLFTPFGDGAVQPGGPSLENGFSDFGVYRAPFTGTYLLALAGYVYENSPQGVLDLAVTPVTNAESSLALGETVTGSIEHPGQTRAWRLDLAERRRVSVDLLRNSEANWRLEGPSGPVFNAQMYSSGWFVADLEPGPYRFTVSGSGSGTPEFGFRILDLAAAPSLSLAGTNILSANPANSTVARRLPLAAGQPFFARALPSTGFPAYGTWYWTLLDPTGTVVWDSSGNDRGVVTPAVSGDHFLLVGGGILESPTAPGTATFAFLPVTNRTESLALDTPVSGRIETAGQVRTYTFDLAAPTRVAVNSLASSSTFLRLAGPAGEVDAQWLYSGGWRIHDLPAGPYTVTLTASGNDTPEYRFQLVTAPSSPTFTRDAVVSLAFTNARALRFSRVMLEAGQKIYPDPLAQGGFSNFGAPAWRLVDPLGTTLFDNRFNNGPAFSVVNSGPHDLAVSGDVNDPEAPATASFVFRTVADSSGPIALGTTVAATLTTPGEVRQYRFTTLQDTWARFDNLTNAPNHTATLDGPWGRVFSVALWSDPATLHFLPAGDYVLTITASADNTGGFAVRLLDRAAQPVVTLGQTVTASFASARELLGFQVDLSAGQRVNGRILSQSGFNTSQQGWSLLDPLGNPVWNTSLGASASGVAPATGRYSVWLNGPLAEGGNPATVQFVLEDGGLNPPAPFAGAPLDFGTVTTATLASASEATNYVFTLASPALVSLDALDTGNLRWTLRSRFGVVANSVALRNSDWWGEWPVVFRLEAGEYQLTLTGQAGPARFRFLQAGAAPLISPDTDVIGTNTPANATVLYRINGRAGDRWSYQGLPASGFTQRPGCSLWLPSGRTSVINPWQDDFADTFTLPETGTYVLAVGSRPDDTGAGGIHRFRIHTVAETVTSLPLNTPVTGRFTIPGQTLAYTFTLAQPRRVVPNALTNLNNVVWTLRGPAGVVRQNWGLGDMGINAGGRDLALDLPAGSYRLTFDATGAALPEFRFQVLEAALFARTIGYDTPFTITNAPRAAGQFVSFDGVAGQTVFLQGNGSTFLASDGPYADLLFPLGGGLDWNRADGDSGRYGLPRSGRYQLFISGRPGDAGAEGTSGFTLWQVQDRTNALPLGIPQAARIETPGQQWRYRFTLAAPTPLFLDSLSDQSVSVRLDGPSRTLISQRDLRNLEESYEDQMAMAAPGAHELLVFGSGRQTNAFGVVLANPSAAPVLVPGSDTTFIPAEARRSGLYRFTAAAGDRFYFRVLGQEGFGGGFSVRLFGPRGQRLWTTWFTTDFGPFAVPAAGEYYLVLNTPALAGGTTPQYRFNLGPVPPTPVQDLLGNTSLPDLLVEDLGTAPASTQSGGTFTVTWTTRNAGAAPVDRQFTERVTVRGPGGLVLASRNVTDSTAGLAPGATRSRSASVTLPDGPTASGMLLVEVTTDALGQVAEGNTAGTAEANNAATTTINSALAPYPDLVVQNLAANPPTAWLPGMVINVTWDVRNLGSRAVDVPWSDALTVRNLSTGTTLATPVVAAAPAGGLAPGAALARSASFTVPEGRPASGRFTLAVQTDAGAAVFEYNAANNAESNNTAALDLRSGPDLAVLQVNAPGQAMPGEPFAFTYLLTNRGNTAVNGFITDQFLVSPDGAPGPASPLGTAGRSLTLPVAGSLVVTNTATIPRTGDAGPLRLAVRTDVFDAVAEPDEDNNTGLAASLLQVPLVLTLTPASDRVNEGSAIPLSATLSRNGPRTNALSVTLASDNPGKLATPSPVVLPAGQASVGLQLTPGADNLFTGPVPVTLTASAPGFLADSRAVQVLDDNVPSLTLTLPASRLVEGGAITGLVTRLPVQNTNLAVQLLTGDSARLRGPGVLVLPAGQASVPVRLEAPENLALQPPALIGVRALAAGYAEGRAELTVTDNDLPVVTLAVSPRQVAEGAGANAVAVTLTRSPVTAQAVRVALFSGRTNTLLLPTQAVIPAGQAATTVPGVVLDDALVNGDRLVVIAGEILDSFTGASLAGAVPDTLAVTDNDGPALGLQLADAAVREGLSPATVLTLRRNAPATNALAITLVSDTPGAATVPAQVVIPVGATSVTVPVQTLSDGVPGGNRSVTFTATAPGFSSASVLLLVTDADLPDLEVAGISYPTNGTTGGNLPVEVRLANRGFAPVTNASVTRVYLSTDQVVGNDQLVAEVVFSGVLPPGQEVLQTVNPRLPDVLGNRHVIVQANATATVRELLANNNYLVGARTVTLAPAYGAVAETAVELALPGTAIPITGRALRPGGTPAADVPVVVHVAVRGIRRELLARTDAAGAFALVFQPLPTEAGAYEIAAGFPGQAMPPAQDRFNLLGLEVAPFPLVTVAEGGTNRATTTVRNQAEIPLTGLTAEVLESRPGLGVGLSLAATTLPGNGEIALTAEVRFLNPQVVESGAVVRVRSAEGPYFDLPLTARQELRLPRLVARPGQLAVAMVRGRQTPVAFTLANEGGRDTGPLDILLPNAPWLSLASPARLAGLPPGSNAPVTLLLSPEAALPLGTYALTLAFQSTNTASSLAAQFTAVSDGRGDLTVQAEDEYTYFAAGNPPLTNALVIVSDALSGERLRTNRTGADGRAIFTNLTEAYYRVNVTADRHNPFQNTALVTAGQITNVVAFLPRQAVTYTFNVQPTTIDDRYTLQIESTFETQVPMPVVTIDPPGLDIASVPGAEFQTNFVVRNHGLIAADHVVLQIPAGRTFTVTPLVTNLGRLEANTSLTVPVIVRRVADAGRSSGGAAPAAPLDDTLDDNACAVRAQALWDFRCGGNPQQRTTPWTFWDSLGCDEAELFTRVFQYEPLVVPSFAGLPQYAGLPPELLNAITAAAGPAFGGVPNILYRRVCRPAPVLGPLASPAPATTGASPNTARPHPRAGAAPAADAPAPTPEDVCARVKLYLDQSAVLARDAFRATLELNNSLPSQVENLLVTLAINRPDGTQVTELFGIREPVATGLTAVDGTGFLPGNSVGTASWILVPTLEAAPTNGPAVYLVSGTLSYRQDGTTVAIPLAQAPITVYPQPELLVRYFHERDAYGDDPFSPEIEPPIPFSLAAQVLNVGAGEARGLRLSGGTPEIIDNEKGLRVEFRTLGTVLENQGLSPALSVDFGAIAAGTNRAARWLFTTSVQGSFTNFRAAFEHVDALGGRRLSLVRGVEIHELTRLVQADRGFEDGRPDYLVNGEPDPDFLPDRLYLSDGTVAPVTAVTRATVNTNVPAGADWQIALPPGTGWRYFRIPLPDPTNGLIRRLARADGTALALGTNAWITDRFFRGGDRRTVRTNLLHILEFSPAGSLAAGLTGSPPPAAAPDTNAPSSSMALLPETSAESFPLAWSGSDGNGSGIAFYDIFLAVEGGPFNLWRSRTTDTGAVFRGTNGLRYAFFSRATDRAGNVEPIAGRAQAETRVTLTNRPPTLDVGPDRSVVAGESVVGQVLAADPDPGQAVRLELAGGAPVGLFFDPASGGYLWNTGPADAGVYSLRFRATDNGTPARQAERVLRVTVNATNRPPVLEPVGDFLITENREFTLPLKALDSDLPRQSLTYALVQGPAGARLDPATGEFTWRPRGDQGPGTNRLTVRVTDSGVPPRSAERSFTLYVRDTAADLLVALGSASVLLGEPGSLGFSLNSGPEITNVMFRLSIPLNRLDELRLESLADEVAAATLAEPATNTLEVRLDLRPGRDLTATREVARLGFVATPGGDSVLTVLDPTDIIGRRDNGSLVTDTLGRVGYLSLVGVEPKLLLRHGSGPSDVQAVVFGQPGVRYRLESRTNLATGTWSPYSEVSLPTGSTSTVIDLPGSPIPNLFLRFTP